MRLQSLLLSWAMATVSLGAQEDAADEKPVPKTSTPAQIAEQLEHVKRTLLPKVWGDKISASQQEQKKYLAKWQAVTSAHYILFTNGPTATCKKYAVTLEELYAFVKKELPFTDVNHLLTCYIFASPEEYYRFCEVAAGWSMDEAKETAGHATAAYYACYYDSPRSPVVFHEATHQIIGACHKISGVGSWFQEGLAVYFEKKITGEKPAGTIKSDLKRKDYYPLTEFFAIDSLLTDPKGNGLRSYDHAGALIDFMINTDLPPVSGKFKALLDAARQGRGFAEGPEVSAKLVKQVYGLTVPELEALWRQHAGV